MRAESKKDNMKAIFMDAYDAHANALFRYGLLRVSDREVALDLVQDAFTKTWDYMIKGNEIINMRAFLYRTLTNLIIDHYRSRKSVASLETMAEEDGFDPPAPDDEVESMIDGEQVMKVMRRLPEDYREVIFLRYVEGLSVSEISEAIGVSRTLVAVRVHRGLRKLRALFEKPIL